jgi:hypothetical protein
MATKQELEEDEDVDMGDEELEDDEDEGDFMDMGGLLTSLLTTEDGDNVCTALVNIGAILSKNMETQNKILLKILTKLPAPKDN